VLQRSNKVWYVVAKYGGVVDSHAPSNPAISDVKRGKAGLKLRVSFSFIMKPTTFERFSWENLNYNFGYYSKVDDFLTFLGDVLRQPCFRYFYFYVYVGKNLHRL